MYSPHLPFSQPLANVRTGCYFSNIDFNEESGYARRSPKFCVSWF
jgi:hypothetical protein